MSIYFPPSLRGFEPRRVVFSTWVDHVAFGYDLVEAMRPRLTVELGTHNGLSFFTFCQSMQENGVEGLCYAVDTWAGDPQAGQYDQSVVESVRAHAREHYRGFTYLLQMTFNDAQAQFEENSIDLLHIDGLHTYEAVREDFDNWYPRVKPGGIVLMHDTEARLQGYGVWKLWQALCEQHECFSFRHGFGLGVLRKPGGEPKRHPLLKLLFDSSEEDKNALRALYVHASEFMDARRKARRLEAANSGKRAAT